MQWANLICVKFASADNINEKSIECSVFYKLIKYAVKKC